MRTLHLYAKDDWPLIISSLVPMEYPAPCCFADDESGRSRHSELLATVEG